MNECIMRFRQKEDYMSARVYTPFVQVVRQRPKLDYILYGYSRKKHREWKHIKQKLCIFLTRSSSEATEEAEKEKSLNSSSVCISLITSSGQSSLSCVYVVLFLNESIEPSPRSSLFFGDQKITWLVYIILGAVCYVLGRPPNSNEENPKKNRKIIWSIVYDDLLLGRRERRTFNTAHNTQVHRRRTSIITDRKQKRKTQHEK